MERLDALFVKFEQVFGLHPGFRRNHAKGVCIAGYFDGNGRAVRLSKADIFNAVHVPVIGRFSLPAAIRTPPTDPTRCAAWG